MTRAFAAGLVAFGCSLCLGQPPFDITGVWRGQMDGLPAVTLTLSDEGGTLTGAVVFHLIRKEEGKAPASTPGSPEPVFGLRFEGKTLHFQVSHRRAHGDRTANDPPVRFSMRFVDSNHAFLGDSVKLVRDSQQVSVAAGHKTIWVTTDDGVKLEVLDWGGAAGGRPILLLAGYQTAHAFDIFAPKLTSIGPVYGITRRGFGASGSPDAGYSSHRLAQDVLAVIDALHLEKPVLAGHSFGGQDQTILAMEHSDRLGGLVYLNSAEDPLVRDYGVPPPDPSWKLPKRDQPALDKSSFAAYRASQLRAYGADFPEEELRQIYEANQDGSVGRYLPGKARELIFKRLEPVDFSKVRVPVLAFFAGRKPFDEELREYPDATEAEKQGLRYGAFTDNAVKRRHIDDLLKGVPSARVLVIPGANMYIFTSNAEDLVPEIAKFVAGIRP